MPTLKPNHRQVLTAKAVDGKRTRYMIEGAQGLMLDVAPRGSRYWYVRYQLPGIAKRTFRFYRIGNARSIGLADAMKRAAKVLHQVEYDGRDPYQERLEPEQEALTVAGLIDEFLTRHVRRKLAAETLKQYEYRLKAFVEPEIGTMDAAEVRKRDIIELADAIAEDGKRVRKPSGRGSKGGDREGGAPRLADAIVEIVCSMYSWALKRDLLEYNPAFRVAKYAERTRRHRVLKNPEVPKFWSGAEHPKVGTELTSILRLLLVTGQRRGEVAGARVDELRLDGNDPNWTIGGERTKNRLTHTVPLGPLGVSLWQDAMKAFAGKVYVFPSSRSAASEHVHPGAVTRAMRTIREAHGLDDLTVHDLRRTVRTRMAELRVPKEISARVLNHVDEFERGVHDESYNRYDYFSEKLDAVVKWEAELKLLLAGQGATGTDRTA